MLCTAEERDGWVAGDVLPVKLKTEVWTVYPRDFERVEQLQSLSAKASPNKKKKPKRQVEQKTGLQDWHIGDAVTSEIAKLERLGAITVNAAKADDDRVHKNQQHIGRRHRRSPLGAGIKFRRPAARPEQLHFERMVLPPRLPWPCDIDNQELVGQGSEGIACQLPIDCERPAADGRRNIKLCPQRRPLSLNRTVRPSGGTVHQRQNLEHDGNRGRLEVRRHSR